MKNRKKPKPTHFCSVAQISISCVHHPHQVFWEHPFINSTEKWVGIPQLTDQAEESVESKTFINPATSSCIIPNYVIIGRPQGKALCRVKKFPLSFMKIDISTCWLCLGCEKSL